VPLSELKEKPQTTGKNKPNWLSQLFHSACIGMIVSLNPTRYL
jgi:hypothetical protein